MKIVLLTIGKTKESFLKSGINQYITRLKHYTNFQIIEIVQNKKLGNITHAELVDVEGKIILKHVDESDYLILLDSKGIEYTSLEFSTKIQKWMLSGKKRLVFAIGGPYGFSQDMYIRSNEKLSLSKMTFSHQMIRLFFLEQLYRSYTIINNSPYHHE